MTIDIQPLDDRVIVKRIDKGERIRGGIIIKIEGDGLLIIREDEILGIIKRAGAAASSGGKNSSK
jgi:co-chaperonin GroES (HSP10)